MLLSGRDRIKLCFAIGRLLDLHRTMLYYVAVGFEQEVAKARTRAALRIAGVNTGEAHARLRIQGQSPVSTFRPSEISSVK